MAKKEKKLALGESTLLEADNIQEIKLPSKYDKKYFEARRQELKSIFDGIKPDLQEQADYLMASSPRFIVRNVNKARQKNKKLLDSTPLLAIRNFASGMMSGATSPTEKWFKTGLMKKQVESWETKNWCAKQAELSRRILQASNFYQILPDVYKQMGVFSFAAVAIERDFDSVVNFQLLPIGSYFYSKNSKGKIDTFCRNYMMSARNLIEQFGKENCSDSVLEFAQKTPNKMIEIVHFVEPNKDYVTGSPISSQKEFISVYYEVGSNDKQSNKFLKKSGFSRFPFVVFETSVNGEDNYPNDGPAAIAMPDIKQLMAITKEYAKAVKKIVTPAYKGPASLKGKGLTDNPGAYNETDENGNGLSPVYEVNPQILQIKQEKDELKQIIKEHFYNDLFAMILNTAERGRTATEVNELKEEKLVLLMPLLGQINTALKEILDWLFYEEISLGILPEIPEELQGQEVEIEFISAFAQTLKARNIASIERFTTFVSNLAGAIDPVLTKKIKGEKIIDDYADFANIDPEHVASSDEVAQYREMMNQKQQQQEQLNAVMQGSQMIKNMGGADAFGSELMERIGQ